MLHKKLRSRCRSWRSSKESSTYDSPNREAAIFKNARRARAGSGKWNKSTAALEGLCYCQSPGRWVASR